MSLFSSILNKLGITPQASPAGPTPAVPHTPPAAVSQPAQALPTPAAMPAFVVDVPAKLDLLVTMSKEKLDWRHSIVDLLKALGLDSSFAARKAMAIELGCPADKMGDSAQMNIWLHKAVMRKLADNHGNIPAELLD
jgi:hypothetical protein